MLIFSVYIDLCRVLIFYLPHDLLNSESVKNFCEINFGINFPMSEVTRVVGKNAHPFYLWLANEYNFIPRWNFNKVLIDKNGEIVNTYGAMVKPSSKKIVQPIVSLLKN